MGLGLTMTDNEIIKELQEEIHLIEYVNGDYSTHASLEMLKGCLDLINRQKVEIKKLREENDSLKNGYFQKHYEEYEQQELCSLRQAWRQSQMDYISLDAEWEGKYKTAKSEAIREFAKKFKSTLENLEANSPNKTYQIAMQDMLDYYVPKIIDDLVKEMTEGENGRLF